MRLDGVPAAQVSPSPELQTFSWPVRCTLQKPAFAVRSTAVSIGKSAENRSPPVRSITRSVFSGRAGITVSSGPLGWVKGQAWVLPRKPMQALPVLASCRSSTSVTDAANDGRTLATVWSAFALTMP
jgi:hypothetical protein